jgi:mono/diheme cytochrome c family protein
VYLQPADRLWAWCIIGALWSCGGLAADGVDPEANGLGGAAVEDGPSLLTPVRETCEDNPFLAGCSGTPSPVRPVRETCEDNPLLAGCPGAGTGGNPSSPPEGAEEGLAEDEEPAYVAAAQNVLLSHCGACHGPALSEDQASARINYIGDWDQLIGVGFIEECSPEGSLIIEIMRTGQMPPPSSGLSAVQAVDVDVVVEAIALDCRNE